MENLKINEGFTKIGFTLDKFKTAPVIKDKLQSWQDLALGIIKDLNIPAKDRSMIFLVCKRFGRSYIERCLNTTKEKARGDLKGHYFIKVIYSKPPVDKKDLT